MVFPITDKKKLEAVISHAADAVHNGWRRVYQSSEKNKPRWKDLNPIDIEYLKGRDSNTADDKENDYEHFYNIGVLRTFREKGEDGVYRNIERIDIAALDNNQLPPTYSTSNTDSAAKIVEELNSRVVNGKLPAYDKLPLQDIALAEHKRFNNDDTAELTDDNDIARTNAIIRAVYDVYEQYQNQASEYVTDPKYKSHIDATKALINSPDYIAAQAMMGLILLADIKIGDKTQGRIKAGIERKITQVTLYLPEDQRSIGDNDLEGLAIALLVAASGAKSFANAGDNETGAIKVGSTYIKLIGDNINSKRRDAITSQLGYIFDDNPLPLNDINDFVRLQKRLAEELSNSTLASMKAYIGDDSGRKYQHSVNVALGVAFAERLLHKDADLPYSSEMMTYTYNAATIHDGARIYNLALLEEKNINVGGELKSAIDIAREAAEIMNVGEGNIEDVATAIAFAGISDRQGALYKKAVELHKDVALIRKHYNDKTIHNDPAISQTLLAGAGADAISEHHVWYIIQDANKQKVVNQSLTIRDKVYGIIDRIEAGFPDSGSYVESFICALAYAQNGEIDPQVMLTLFDGFSADENQSKGFLKAWKDEMKTQGTERVKQELDADGKPTGRRAWDEKITEDMRTEIGILLNRASEIGMEAAAKERGYDYTKPLYQMVVWGGFDIDTLEDIFSTEKNHASLGTYLEAKIKELSQEQGKLDSKSIATELKKAHVEGGLGYENIAKPNTEAKIWGTPYDQSKAAQQDRYTMH